MHRPSLQKQHTQIHTHRHGHGHKQTGKGIETITTRAQAMAWRTNTEQTQNVTPDIKITVSIKAYCFSSLYVLGETSPTTKPSSGMGVSSIGYSTRSFQQVHFCSHD